jgi:hypothetical protein
MISVLPHKRRRMLDSMVSWYPRKTHFVTWDRCSRRMRISMKMLVIKLKSRLKWCQASGVLCDPSVPLKLKVKFYRIVIRPAILYEAECWPTKRRHVQQLSVGEMRMLQWICGHTRRDQVRNDDICERLGVAPVQEKFVQHRLRWFEHIQRRPAKAPIHNGVITNR